MVEERITESIIPATEWMAAIKPLLDDGLTLKISPSGLSMYPFLVGGRDEVLLRSAETKKLRRGDITLYSREDGLHVLHRIHHIKNNEYYMLGDAQTGIEGPIARKNVHAVAEAVIWKNNQIGCDDILLSFLVNIWLLLRPVRPIIIRTRSTLTKIFKK